MGLFSFLKNAGAKIFKKKAVEAAPAEAATEAVAPEVSKIQALETELSRLGIPVNNLSLDISEQITVSGETTTNADREKIILALGNIEGIGCVDDRLSVTNPEPEATFYTVKKGDSLSLISKSQYGDAMKYKAIFEANKPMLAHPDKIYPGQVLRIPPLA